MNRKSVQQQPTEPVQNKQAKGKQAPAQSNRKDRQNKFGASNQTMERERPQRSTGNA